MNQRDVDTAALVGQGDVLGTRLVGGVASPAPDAESEEPEGPRDYLPVPPRSGQARLVWYRRGARLRPLPYPLDEENS
jgi:hypothetical protein